jgi:hypothetical protein
MPLDVPIVSFVASHTVVRGIKHADSWFHPRRLKPGDFPNKIIKMRIFDSAYRAVFNPEMAVGETTNMLLDCTIQFLRRSARR